MGGLFSFWPNIKSTLAKFILPAVEQIFVVENNLIFLSSQTVVHKLDVEPKNTLVTSQIQNKKHIRKTKIIRRKNGVNHDARLSIFQNFCVLVNSVSPNYSQSSLAYVDV